MGSYSFGHLAFQLCTVSPELGKQAGALGLGQAARILHDMYIQTCYIALREHQSHIMYMCLP